MNKTIRFSLLSLLMMFCGTAFADYEKVTATADITDGEYLIVYEGGNVAFNGALATLDATDNTVAVTIADSKIASTDAIDAATFTIDVAAGTIKSASGNYIGVSSNSNGLKQTTNAATYKHTFAISDGSAIISAQFSGSTMTMQYNSGSDQNRFRYFKSVNQNPIQLYKKVAEDTGALVVPNYTVDFNESITTSNHDFAVANKWGHIVGSGNYDGWGPYYMSYSYYSTSGVGSTGCLYAARQYAGNNWGGTVCYDLLVTPQVKGTITLKVKASYSASSTNNAFVEFYAVDNAGTTRGELLKTVKEDIPGYNTGSGAEWVEATLDVADYQRIGIRAQYVYLDDFTATSMQVVKEAGMTVASVMNSEGNTGNSGTTTYFSQQADGKLKVDLLLNLTNTGDFNLVSGTTANYTLTLASASYSSGTKTYYDDATINVPVDLAVGETKTNVPVTFYITKPTSSWNYYFVRENINGTTSSSSRYAGITAYESKFVFRAAGTTSTSSLNVTQAFGVVSETTSKSYEIYNDGTAPFTINSITLPDGFTSTDLPAAGTVVESKQKVTFTVTLPADVMGAYSGDLTVNYTNEKSEAKTYTIGLSGNVITPGVFVADFASSQSGTVDFPAGSIKEAGVREGTTNVSSDVYDGYLYSFTSTSYANADNKFITPLLHAEAGDKLSFDVSRDGYSSATYNLKVYVSTDRMNWGEPVFSITAADLTSAFQNKSISFDKAGDYYVAFAIYGVRLDNVIGLKKVDVDHDIYFSSVTLPGEQITSGKKVDASVTIIPLTTEAAADYTVKYYFDDQAVATATSKALTATATATQLFNFSYTPEVEKNTTYDTYIAFEFTDGTVIETQHVALTVTYEPEFHLYTSLPSSKWYKPADRTAPIEFGTTNAPGAKQSFYIYNYGAAPMQVKQILLPAGFSTTLEAPITVPAYDENALSQSAQAIDIIFSAEYPNEFEGNLRIVYVDGNGDDQTFSLPISGTMLDASKFFANFDNATTNSIVWPAGAVYQKNISNASSNYSAPYNFYIYSTNTTDNLFITPKVKALAGDKMSFDARLYSSTWTEGAVKVYAAETREQLLDNIDACTLLTTVSGTAEDEANKLTTDYQTFKFTVPAGECYIGFAIEGRAYLDEIYGLTVVDVAHDWMLDEASVPTEAMQNVNSTATVKLRNIGLAEEAAGSYSIVAYVDGVATEAEGTVAIPATNSLSSAATELSATFRSPKAGTYPVYFEVKAGDYSVQTEPVEVTFAEEVAVADAIQVGTQSGTGRDYGFVDWYYADGSSTRYTDILYTAAKIQAAGIKAGDKITAISFKASNSAKTFKAKVTSWVSTSTGEITYGTPDKDNMAEVVVYDGSSVSFPANFESVITLPEAIVWDGTSDIRVYTEAVGQGSGNWISATYAYDSDLTMSYNGTTKAAPLAYFTLAAEPATIAGTVTDGVAPIEGATVTLVSTDGDNIQYTGTTDAEGKYTINVVQSTRDYTAMATLEDYVAATAEVSFAEGNVTQDFVLASTADLADLKQYAELIKKEKMNKDVRAALVAAAAAEPGDDVQATLEATRTLKAAYDAAVASRDAYANVASISTIANKTNVYTPQAYIAFSQRHQPQMRLYYNETMTTEEAQAYYEDMLSENGELAQLLLSAWEGNVSVDETGKLVFAGNAKATVANISEGVYDVTGDFAGEATFQAVGGEAVTLTAEGTIATEANLKEQGEMTFEVSVTEGAELTLSNLWFELNAQKTAEQEKDDELAAAQANLAAARADLQKALDDAKALLESTDLDKATEESKNALTAAIAEAEALLADTTVPETTSECVAKTKEATNAAKALRTAAIELKKSIAVGIEAVMAGKLDLNAPMYDVNGQRVDRTYRGIVIQNGRKFRRK